MQIRIPAAQVEVLAEADVVVCGGGCAGVTAAVAAARHGASVVLVEESAQRAEKESWIVRDGNYPHAHETHWFDLEGMRMVWQRTGS